MEEKALSEFAMWGGWIVSGVLALLAALSSSIGWYIRGKQAEFLAVKKDLHEAIDKATKALSDFEERSVSYWCEENTKTYSFHILSSHKRLVSAYKQIAEFRSLAIPTPILSELRKTVTLDFESAARPISSDDPRMTRLLTAVSKALDSDFLLKSWKHDESVTFKDVLLSDLKGLLVKQKK